MDNWFQVRTHVVQIVSSVNWPVMNGARRRSLEKIYLAETKAWSSTKQRRWTKKFVDERRFRVCMSSGFFLCLREAVSRPVSEWNDVERFGYIFMFVIIIHVLFRGIRRTDWRTCDAHSYGSRISRWVQLSQQRCERVELDRDVMRRSFSLTGTSVR